MPPRYSRHYYDLATMAKANEKEGALKLLPSNYRFVGLKKDYAFMSHMIFDKYLEFDVILEILSELEKRING
jgi:hypothetical protein